MKTFGERAKFARNAANLTQEQLASRIKDLLGEEVTQAAISRWEGKKSEGTKYSAILALITGVDPIWLLSGKGEPKANPPKELNEYRRRSVPKIPEEFIADWLAGNYEADPGATCALESHASAMAFASKVSEVKSSNPLLSPSRWTLFDPEKTDGKHALIAVRNHYTVRDVEREAGKTYFVGGRETLELGDVGVAFVASVIGVSVDPDEL